MIVRIDAEELVSAPSKFTELEKRWARASDAIIQIRSALTNSQAECLVGLCVERLPSDFAVGILSEIAEMKNLSKGLIEELMAVHEPEVMISLCLRHDLPMNHLLSFLRCDIPEVIEHVVFHPKVTIRQCQSLLRTARRGGTVNAIERAIQAKKGK